MNPKYPWAGQFLRWLGIAYAALAILMIGGLLIMDTPKSVPAKSVTADIPPSLPPSPVMDLPLQAAAGCIGDAVVVQNLGSELWLNARIEVNGDYEHTADAIAPGDKLNFMPAIFTRSDGTRLDLARVACKRIDIHATVDGKRRHYNGAYR